MSEERTQLLWFEVGNPWWSRRPPLSGILVTPLCIIFRCYLFASAYLPKFCVQVILRIRTNHGCMCPFLMPSQEHESTCTPGYTAIVEIA